MTGQSDDKKGERAAQRLTLDEAGGLEAPKTDATAGKVTDDVARVVNLLQRLDKLHSKPVSLEPSIGSPSPPVHAMPRVPGADGLSSLSALRDRGAARTASSAPVPYLVPPSLPPVLPPFAAPPLLPDTAIVDELPSVLTKAGALGDPSGKRVFARGKADRAPVALIVSVIMGMVALGSWGLFHLQGGSSGVKRSGLTAAIESTAPAQARLDAVGTVAIVSQPKAEPSEGVVIAGCGSVALTAAHGALTLIVTDPSRGSQSVPITVDELAFRAAFGASGRLQLKAPLLAETAAVRWVGSAGANCEQAAVLPADGPLLRVALVWTGEAPLDLHVIEPNSWFGGPSGHISNLAPNADRVRGLGAVETFGSRDGTSVIVYAVDPVRIPAGGIINAFVKPAAPGSAGCSETAKPAAESQVRYQVHILRSGNGQGLQREIQSFSMQLPSCGESGASGAPSERIMVRN